MQLLLEKKANRIKFIRRSIRVNQYRNNNMIIKQQQQHKVKNVTLELKQNSSKEDDMLREIKM